MSKSNIDTFTNIQLDVETLPKVQDLIYQPLESRYKTVLLLGRLIFTAVATFTIGAVLLFSPIKELVPMWAIYLFIAIYILYIVLGFVATLEGFRHKSFALRERDIIYKEGWIWKDHTTTPFNRVQHVSIDQGPIERNFNLSKLKIFTAGGRASDITIPGLDPITADQLKEFIVSKTLKDKSGESDFHPHDEEQ